MRRTLVSIAALLAAIVVSGPGAAQNVEERPDLLVHFTKQGTTGSFVLLDIAAERMVVADRDRAETPYVPASTFEIANGLFALETGAVRDAAEIVPYGGLPQPLRAWEKDMALGEAIRASNVAVFQEIARRIGVEQMQAGVDMFGYGNRRIGDVIDRFWLDGPLEISAVEQAEFLAKLAQRRLPVAARSQEILRDLLRIEQRGDATLYAKTGWYAGRKPAIGWLVGWTERAGTAKSFALNMDMPNPGDEKKRLLIGKALLSALGAY